jgi:3'(2'), 5'-bisphosphate nucleotidase
MTAPTLDFATLSRFADHLESTARECGRVIMDIYESDFEVHTKADKSPVTAADEASEEIILKALKEVVADIPFVAEEHIAAHGFPNFEGNTFWLIDALDGTKEFINKRGAFTVNIGLIVDGQPCLGIVYAPARDEMFRGVNCPTSREQAALVERNGKRETLSVRAIPQTGVTVVGSFSHQVKEPMDNFLAGLTVENMIAIGSSLKFCLVAEGKADLYPRFGPTCEWDIAAGHAVLRAAGGSVKTFDGKDIIYKKANENYRNGTFLAAGTP